MINVIVYDTIPSKDRFHKEKIVVYFIILPLIFFSQEINDIANDSTSTIAARLLPAYTTRGLGDRSHLQVHNWSRGF